MYAFVFQTPSAVQKIKELLKDKPDHVSVDRVSLQGMLRYQHSSSLQSISGQLRSLSWTLRCLLEMLTSFFFCREYISLFIYPALFCYKVKCRRQLTVMTFYCTVTVEIIKAGKTKLPIFLSYILMKPFSMAQS